MKSVTKVKGLVTDRLRVEGRPTKLLVYRFTGTAEDPETIASGPIGYDLLPLYTTLWKAASTGESETFGETVDYGTRTIVVVGLGAGKRVDCRAAPSHDRDDRLGASRSGRRAEQGAGALGLVRQERARPTARRVVLRSGRYGPASRWCGDRAMGDGVSAPAVSRRDPRPGDRDERVGCGRPAVNAFPYCERHRASTYP